MCDRVLQQNCTTNHGSPFLKILYLLNDAFSSCTDYIGRNSNVKAQDQL
jgi:hypothetical protein